MGGTLALFWRTEFNFPAFFSGVRDSLNCGHRPALDTGCGKLGKFFLEVNPHTAYRGIQALHLLCIDGILTN